VLKKRPRHALKQSCLGGNRKENEMNQSFRPITAGQGDDWLGGEVPFFKEKREERGKEVDELPETRDGKREGEGERSVGSEDGRERVYCACGGNTSARASSAVSGGVKDEGILKTSAGLTISQKKE